MTPTRIRHFSTSRQSTTSDYISKTKAPDYIGSERGQLAGQFKVDAQLAGFKLAPTVLLQLSERSTRHAKLLQRYFNERVLEILTRNGKRMIGWDEIFQEGLPKTIVIQSWRGRESLFESARLGYSGILSNGYYIDLMHPAAEHYAVDPLGGAAADYFIEGELFGRAAEIRHDQNRFIESAELLITIPMPGGTESLNAAVAGSLLAYELSRRPAGS